MLTMHIKSLTLFLLREFAFNVPLHQLQPTLIQLLQQRQHRAQYVFVPVVAARILLLRLLLHHRTGTLASIALVHTLGSFLRFLLS